ncbi:hypothetical protein CA267_009950 [Alteromonas pelagimontana]|uniref:FlgO domain-containing protein n=1 Tax=Alteromonas pelagimontana TaxID=1858656 RepID=A0A6M4MDC0_9ALTE|nr:FlgO family outer membrane protein [Alteromonas pelagimontana]QJR81079.1 hypothetical protein CA267_009950 [Alteromonas pelagimontana]
MLRFIQIIMLSLGILLAGCSANSQKQSHAQELPPPDAELLHVVEDIADSLVHSSSRPIHKGRIAVGTIGQIDTLRLEENRHHPLTFLGLKLQDSLMVALQNRGLRVVDYKRSANVIIHSTEDQMLSRELKHLGQSKQLDYFLSGTISYQENGATISLRMVDLLDDELVAATNDFVPIDIFFPPHRVTEYNGRIYRDSKYRSGRRYLGEHEQ